MNGELSAAGWLAGWLRRAGEVVLMAVLATGLTIGMASAASSDVDPTRPDGRAGVRLGGETSVAARADAAWSYDQYYTPKHAVAVGSDRAGAVTVMWVTDGVLRSRLRSPAGRWGRPVIVDCARPQVRSCSSPQVSVAATGLASATWEVGLPPPPDDGLTETYGGLSDVAAADRSAAGVWGTPTTVATTAYRAVLGGGLLPSSDTAPTPNVFTGGGATLVTWLFGQDQRNALWGVYRPPGVSWAHAQLALLGRADFGASVAMSRSGSALVVLQGYARRRARLYVPGVGWSAPEQIAVTESPVAAAMGPGGRALAAWNTGPAASRRRIQERAMSASGSWGPVRDLSGHARSDSDPAVGLGADGTGYVAWIERASEGLGAAATMHLTRTEPTPVVRTGPQRGAGPDPVDEPIADPGDVSFMEQLELSVGRDKTAVASWISYPDGMTGLGARGEPQPRTVLSAMVRAPDGSWSVPAVVAGERSDNDLVTVPAPRGYLMVWLRGQRLMARSIEPAGP